MAARILFLHKLFFSFQAFAGSSVINFGWWFIFYLIIVEDELGYRLSMKKKYPRREIERVNGLKCKGQGLKWREAQMEKATCCICIPTSFITLSLWEEGGL